ncbi:hypothetical protein HNV12_25770 [Methanococcoides sp. SA1]|nr:hypothetical protein [Methanococcoides sp. SA1]
MKDYVSQVCESLNLKFEITHPKSSFEEQFFKVHMKGAQVGEMWGFPYTKDPCWILRDLKALNLDQDNFKALYLLKELYFHLGRIQKDINLRTIILIF